MKAAIVILLAGCTTAVTIENNVCGNGVIEDGEDCDGVGDANFDCSACRFRCDVLDDTCPAGFVCGADILCHHPTGTFESVVVNASFGAQQFAIADVDGNDIGDAIGVSGGNVSILYGSDATPLEASFTHATPSGSGDAAIGDYTKEGLADVLIATTAGIFGFENREASSSPAVFPFLLDAARVFLRSGVVGDGRLVRLDETAPATIRLQLVRPNSTDPAPKRLCGHTFTDGEALAGRSLAVFREPSVSDRVWVPVLIDRPAAEPLLCIEQATSTIEQVPVALDLGTDVADRGDLVFGEFLPGDPCPDLAMPLVRGGGELAQLRAGVTTGAGCTWVATGTVGNRIEVGGVPLARVRRAVGTDLLLTSNGLYDLATPSSPVVAATRPWSVAATGDFDHDGNQDFAVASILGDDIEVFEQRPPGTWRVVRVALTAIVADLAAGDLDGDTFDDLAIGTFDLDTLGGEVYVAYGSASTFSDAKLELTMERYTHLTMAQLPDPSIPTGFDVYDDLVITAGFPLPEDPPGDAPPGTVNYVYGSANRQLTAPWRPDAVRIGADGVVTGRFGKAGEPGVFALFHANACDLQGTTPRNALVLDRTNHTFAVANELDTCDVSHYDLRGIRLVAVPVGDTDMVLGLSAPQKLPTDASRICAIYAWADGSVVGKVPCDAFAATTDAMAVSSLFGLVSVKVRVGTDGTTLIVFGVVGGVERVFEWQLDAARDAVPALRDPIAIDLRIDDRGVTIDHCFDAAIAELGTLDDKSAGIVYGDGGPEEIFACAYTTADDPTLRSRLYARYVQRGARDHDRFVPVGEIFGHFLVDIEAGDVTGDGLADIVARSISSGVQLFTQCDHVPCGAKR